MIKQERPCIKTERFKYMTISVFSVMKCNFNDEWLIDSKDIPISELSGDNFIWFDPFLGFNRGEEQLIALSRLSDERGELLIKVKDVYKKEESERPISFTVTAKKDESSFLASHIRISRDK